MFRIDVATSNVIDECSTEWIRERKVGKKGERNTETLRQTILPSCCRESKHACVCVTFMLRIEGEGWRCIIVVPQTPSKRRKKTRELRKRRKHRCWNETTITVVRLYCFRFFVGFFGSASTRNQAGSVERSAIVWPRAADLYLYQPGIFIFSCKIISRVSKKRKKNEVRSFSTNVDVCKYFANFRFSMQQFVEKFSSRTFFQYFPTMPENR